ncbi:MAG TPA: acyl-CoA dehydrogenase family protein, partial [Kofleriaceae bacterium]|nr:acyl-CoA dehydrogenase family protein [Kofleriaceae bacterium]
MHYLFETEEHAAIRQTMRRFAHAHIAPHSAAWEEAEEFPLELYRVACDAGVTGVGYPEALGGQGGDLSHVLVASDELVQAGRSVGVVVGLGSHGIALPPIV